MPLDSQNVPLILNKGINTKSDSKQSIPGELISLENGIFKTINEIRKRDGYNALSTTIEGGSNQIINSISGSTFKEEVIQFTPNTGYSYSEITQKWSSKGKIVQTNITQTQISQNANAAINQNSAYHSSGMAMVTWNEYSGGATISLGGGFYSVIDTETGNIIANRIQIPSATLIKPFVLGNLFVIFYHDNSTNIKYIAVPAGDPLTPGLPSNFITDSDINNSLFDCFVYNGKAYVAYNSGGNSIAVKTLDISLIASSKYTIVTGAGVVASNSISVFSSDDGSNFWIFYFNGTTLNGIAFTPSFVPLFPVATIETPGGSIVVSNISGYASSATANIFYELVDTSGSSDSDSLGDFCYTKKSSLSNSGSVGTASTFINNVGLVSKWFTYNSVRYTIVAFQSYGPFSAITNFIAGPQNSYFVVDSTGSVVGKALYLSGGGYTGLRTFPTLSGTGVSVCEIGQISSSSFYCALLAQPSQLTILDSSALTTNTPITNYGVVLDTISFSSNENYIDAESGNNLIISGSVAKMYDGQSLVEHGFNVFPLVNASGGGKTGGSMSSGTYLYYAVFEWLDGFGQWHRSAPSLLSSFTLSSGTDTQIKLIISYLTLTDKTNVLVNIYRSDSGSPFRLIYSQPNSKSSQSFTLYDTVDQGGVNTNNSQIYTTGNVVSNNSLPAVKSVFNYKSRVIGIPSEQPFQFWYTKAIVPGSPPEFSQEFVQNVTTKLPLTCGIQMDDKMVLFTNNTIGIVTGDGPSDNGQQNDFSDMQIIATDCGCINPVSPVLFPGGVIFESAKGRYLLDRSLQVSYIGAQVEAYNSNTTIAATLVPNTTQIRIILDNGIALVYDYLVGQWSTFTNHNAVSAFVWNGAYSYLRSNGQVLNESSSSYSDNGTFYALKFTTNWLEFAGVQGFQRVKKLLVLGDYKSPHKLQIDLAYDFDSTITQSSVVDVNSLYPLTVYGGTSPYGGDSVYGGAFPSEQFRIFTSRQKCDAIQITVQDILATTPGEGFSISNLSFEVGVKKGLNKLPAAQSVG